MARLLCGAGFAPCASFETMISHSCGCSYAMRGACDDPIERRELYTLRRRSRWIWVWMCLAAAQRAIERSRDKTADYIRCKYSSVLHPAHWPCALSPHSHLALALAIAGQLDIAIAADRRAG